MEPGTHNSLPLQQRGSNCWLWAAAGSVLIGVTLPVVLTCWHCWGRDTGFTLPSPHFTDPVHALTTEEFLTECVMLQIFATVLCGPGAIVLSLCLFAYLRFAYKDEVAQTRFVSATVLGMGIAFLNFPGCAATAMVHPARVFLLFVVAGSTCGMWTGWQAWRSVHPEAGWLPRFSLKTMLMLVIAWAVLLLIFAPAKA